MTTATIRSTFLVGFEARPATVVVTVTPGLPTVDVVGMPEAAVREARVRVRSAIVHSGFTFPEGRINVEIQPVHTRKDGTGFDLPIALAMLAASGQISADRFDDKIVIGELALDGCVRAVRAAFCTAETAFSTAAGGVVVAEDNAAEAACFDDDIVVHAARHLRDVAAWANGHDAAMHVVKSSTITVDPRPVPDLSEVRGQPEGRRALEIAASGGHNLLLIGGPGSGKTMLARRLNGILPAPTDDETRDITRAASCAGLNVGGGRVVNRPFRAPHHSTTGAGLIGGGPTPRPGEITLADRGVLFLDEVPEFAWQTLEMTREVVRAREVALHRATGTVAYPARCLVVAAANPCPCGQHGHPRLRCKCSAVDLARFTDRIAKNTHRIVDMVANVPPVNLADLASSDPMPETSAAVRARVVAARDVLASHHETRFTDDAKASERNACIAGALTGYTRQKAHDVARTIAVMAGSFDDDTVIVDAAHIDEAITLVGAPTIARVDA